MKGFNDMVEYSSISLVRVTSESKRYIQDQSTLVNADANDGLNILREQLNVVCDDYSSSI